MGCGGVWGRSATAAQGPSAARGAAWGWGLKLHCMLGALQRGLFKKEDQICDFLPCVHFPTHRVVMTGEMEEELSTLAHHGDCCTVALEMSRFVSSILVFHQPFLTRWTDKQQLC